MQKRLHVWPLVGELPTFQHFLGSKSSGYLYQPILSPFRPSQPTLNNTCRIATLHLTPWNLNLNTSSLAITRTITGKRKIIASLIFTRRLR